MQLPAQCPRCNGTNLVREVEILDRTDAGSHPLSARIYGRPAAALFRMPRDFPLTAWVCGTCGYTELSVSDPQGLQAARLQSSGGLPAGAPPPPTFERASNTFMRVAVLLAIILALGMAALVFLLQAR